MLFNSFVFLLLFLPATYVVFWSLQSARARRAWLAATGYVFYGYWDPRFCGLMAFSTLVSYTAGLGFLKYTSPRARRLCLVVPITVDLCLLGFFKYAQFGLDSAQFALRAFGHEFAVPRLGIILPVGISFYTFHTITYIVDSYRGVVKPTRDLVEFTAYVSLFSQLVAGPIVRFRQIEQDLEQLGSADRGRWLSRGVWFFVIGLVEKVLLADALAAFVDPAFSRVGSLSCLEAWLAVLGYSFQIYFDFCGYSDMAVGLGYLFGLRIPQNFNSPYKAENPSDFWRRWHISLSSCLRDYLYIPLGGNRGGKLATYRNLMLTMLLGGLWHGANWTFVAWGAYHGLLLALYRAWGGAWDALPALARRLGMFLLAVIGWAFFRCATLSSALELLARMFAPSAGFSGGGTAVAALLALAAGLSMSAPNAFESQERFVLRVPQAAALAAAFGACVALMAGGRESPFIYFQF